MFLWCQEVCTCRVFFKLVRYVCRLCRTDWPLHNQRQEEMSCFKVRNWWQQHGVQALTSEADDIGSKNSLCPVWEQCSWLKPISVLGVLEVKQKRRATPVVTLKQTHTHTQLYAHFQSTSLAQPTDMLPHGLVMLDWKLPMRMITTVSITPQSLLWCFFLVRYLKVLEKYASQSDTTKLLVTVYTNQCN